MSCKVGAYKSLLSLASVQWKLLLQLCPDAKVRNVALNIRFLEKYVHIRAGALGSNRSS